MPRKLPIAIALSAVLGGVWAVVFQRPSLVAGAVALFLAAGWLARRALAREIAEPYRGIAVDEAGVCHGEHAIRWEELARIRIVTTDQGPFADDLFWVFEAATGSRCVVIPGPAVDGRFFDWLKRLPDVDYEQIISAQGSCSNAEFLIWTAPVRAQHSSGTVSSA